MADEKPAKPNQFPVGKSGNPGGWGAEKLRNYRELARKVRECTDDGTRIVRLCGRFLGAAEMLTELIEKDLAPKPETEPKLTRSEVRELSAMLKEITTATVPVVKELNDRGYGKAVQTIDLHVDDKPTDRPSPNWDAMSIEDKRRLLDAAEALSALTDTDGDEAPTEH